MVRRDQSHKILSLFIILNRRSCCITFRNLGYRMSSQVDDIEDIVSASHDSDIRVGNKTHVVPRNRRLRNKEAQEASGDSVIPGNVCTNLELLIL